MVTISEVLKRSGIILIGLAIISVAFVIPIAVIKYSSEEQLAIITIILAVVFIIGLAYASLKIDEANGKTKNRIN